MAARKTKAKKGGVNAVALAQIRKMSVSFGVTANLGNYESCRVDLTVESDVPSGTSTEAHHETLMTACASMIGKQADFFGPVASSILERK